MVCEWCCFVNFVAGREMMGGGGGDDEFLLETGVDGQ